MSRLHAMMVVGDPAIAAHVAAAGLDTLFVDLESQGKAARQGHLDSWKSPHTLETVAAVRAAAPDTELLVRLDPLHEGTAAQIDAVLARGADALMLPMFRDPDTLRRFADLVAGRAKLWPLVETAGALDAVPVIARELRPDRLHIGLNDLHLDLRRSFMFQPLAEGLLEDAAAALRAAAIPFGIGGIARADGGGAVPAPLILGEHARLGSSWVILSRGFTDRATTLDELTARVDFAAELTALRDRYAAFAAAPPEALERNRRAFAAAVAAEVARRRGDAAPG